MTALLELRDKIKEIYARNEVLIKPLIKFLIAFVVLVSVNSELGYMSKINNIAIVLIASLMCSFLPSGCIILFASLFSVLHMYAVSVEVALFGLVIYLLMFLLFFRFSPKDSLVVVLTPLLAFLKIPYVMPIAMGLLGTPASAVSVGCGVIIYFLMAGVKSSVPAIRAMNAEDMTAKLRLIVDSLLQNKAMVVMVIAFAITVIVVYLVRRMSIDYSWTIAMVTGAILDLLILLVGDLIYDTNLSVLSAILGSIVALLIAKVIEFFRFCVDHSRTERVQFEDDEYYYYVKAVPKMTVAAPTKTVKRINTKRGGDEYYGRSSGGSRNAQTARNAGSARRSVTISEDDYEDYEDYDEDEELF
ncbi:MAG: hypothetical protein IJ147_04145 [Lachnospiraceae bacterium]|nr:hypothetical protein [Lachnospiraceae bacterium]